MILLNGKQLAIKLKNELKQSIKNLKTKPKLVCILVGDDEASKIYVRNKVNACEFVGIESEIIKLSGTISEPEIIQVVLELSKNKSVNGILVQLPLPKHINSSNVLNAISPEKDVDGLTYENLGKLVALNNSALVSCTSQGVLALLNEYNIPLEKKNVVIIGRSLLVGKPLFHLLNNENATVTLCHSKTNNIYSHTKKADIVISATGNKNLIKHKHIKKGAVLVDVGIIKENNKIFGDIDFNSASKKASYISPVPGGVGPLTVTFLLKNTLQAYNMQNNNFNNSIS